MAERKKKSGLKKAVGAAAGGAGLALARGHFSEVRPPVPHPYEVAAESRYVPAEEPTAARGTATRPREAGRTRIPIDRLTGRGLAERVPEAEALMLVPTGSGQAAARQFRRMFREEPTPARLRSVERARERAAARGYVGLASAADLEVAIALSPRRYTVVVAHNEGGRIVAPDGSAISIARLARFASERGKRLVLVSCRAAGELPPGHFGTAGTLTYDQAIRIVERLNATSPAARSMAGDEPRWSTGDEDARFQAELEQVGRAVSRAESRARTEVRVRWLALAGGAAGGTYFICDVIDRAGDAWSDDDDPAATD